MSLASLVGELTDQQRRLDLLDADGDPRAGVRAVFSWSYRNLGAVPARVFRLLGLHPGPDLDAHAAAALGGMALADATEALGLLARTHLIQRAGPDRYDLHDLLRAYARELATSGDTEGERSAALTRLLDHYLHAAAAAMDTLYPSERNRRPRIPVPASPVPVLADPALARAWLDTERPNLIALTAYAADWGWPGHATRLAATLARYLEVGGHYPEAIAIYGHAGVPPGILVTASPRPPSSTTSAVIDLRLSRWREAAGYLRQALALGTGTGDLIGQARALGNLGIASLPAGALSRCHRAPWSGSGPVPAGRRPLRRGADAEQPRSRRAPPGPVPGGHRPPGGRRGAEPEERRPAGCRLRPAEPGRYRHPRGTVPAGYRQPDRCHRAEPGDRPRGARAEQSRLPGPYRRAGRAVHARGLPSRARPEAQPRDRGQVRGNSRRSAARAS